MNYEMLCGKYFPHLEQVFDFSQSQYYLTPAEMENLSQKEIAEIDALRQQEFSEEREKHGFSYGGSDVPIIMGVGFIPAVQLLAQKRNPALRQKVNAATQAMFDTGHRAEDFIRDTFERVSGYRAIEWPIMMRNPKYPHFLMNIDGLFFKDGQVCHYEGKWSQNYKIINDHWKKARDIRKDGSEPPLEVAPEKYLYQVWAYQAGLEIDLSVLCGGWGFGDNEIGYIYIPRLSPKKEKELMDTCENFIHIAEFGGSFSDEPFKNKAKLHDFYRKVHPHFPSTGKPVIFDASDMESAKRYLELKEQIKELEKAVDQDVADFKEQLIEQAGIQALKEEKDAIQVFFEGRMEGDSTGLVNDGNEQAVIHWETKRGRRTFDKDKCEKEYPEVFKEVYTSAPVKSFSIDIVDPEDEGGDD